MSMSERRRVGMFTAWRVLADSVLDVRDVGVALIGFNLLWFLCCLPLITAPPATAALYAITRDKALREETGIRDFFGYMWRYAWVGWRWFLLNFVAVGGGLVNIWFYNGMELAFAPLLMALWLVALVIWLCIQQFCFPLLLAQYEPRVLLALRNAAVLGLRHPLFVLTYALPTAAFAVMGFSLPYFWTIFLVALLFFFHTQGALYLLRIEQGDTVPTDTDIQ